MKNVWKNVSAGKGAGKRGAVLALALALILAAGVPVLSSRSMALDLDSDCHLTVNVSPQYSEDLNAGDVKIDVYRIADVQPVNGQETYNWVFREAFSPLVPNKPLTQDVFDDLADAFADKILVQGASTEMISGVAGAPITMKAGMYLVVPHGNMANYINTASGKVRTLARSANYEYTFRPQLISLPTKEADASGVRNTADSYGAFVNDMVIDLKATRDVYMGSLDIVKTVDRFEVREGETRDATFIFQVIAELNGEKVYDNVVALVFDAAGTKTYHLVDKIPVGATVTVSEIYSGAAYDVVSEASKTTVITAGDVASVSFENDYNDENHNGGSVINHFENKGTQDADWEFTKGDPTQQSGQPAE